MELTRLERMVLVKALAACDQKATKKTVASF